MGLYDDLEPETDNPFSDLEPDVVTPVESSLDVVQPTKSEVAWRSTNLYNATPKDIGKATVGIGETILNMGGNFARMSVAGIAGMGSYGASSLNEAIDAVPGATGKRSTPAETVASVQGFGVDESGKDIFGPRTEAGKVSTEMLGSAVEGAGTAIKYPLSAIPFAIAGSEERQEFMDVPLGDYLGELAQDNGASPLFATLAHLAPDIALAGAGGAGVKGATKPPKVKPKIPTVEELKAQSSKLYDLVDDSGVRISDKSFAAAVTNITEDALSKGARQSLTPKTWAALDELGKEVAEGGLTLKKAEELRRVIKKAQNASDTADMASATRALRKWDEYMESIGRKDLSGELGAETVEYLKSARGLWARARKTEIVEDMIDTAKLNAGMFSGSGYENALRTQFRALARKKKQMRMFTKAEQDAIRKVATGGPIENILRFMGKAAPTGVVSAGLGGGAGYMVGGPAGAFLVPAVGGLARRFATRSTVKNAEKASETMRRSPETR